MKKLSKILVLLLLMSMTLMLASCGDSIGDRFQYDDFSKYITLGEYKGIEYKVAEVEVTEEEIENQIQENLQAAQLTNELTEGIVKADDTVNISYVGKLDGEAFEGGSGEDYSLDLANSNFIDGFAEGLVGSTVGETVVLNLTFPEDYSNEELAGQEVVFDVTVNSRTIVTIPEYNEEFIKEYSDYNTKEEYEEYLKNTMLEEKKVYAENEAKSNLFLAVLDGCEIIEYPENELNETYETAISSYEDLAVKYDMEYTEFVEQNLGVSVEEFENQASEYSETVIKQELVVYAIAKEEEITITDDEYQDFLNEALDEAGYDRDSFEAVNDGVGIEEYAKQNDFYSKMLMEKIVDLLVEYSA